jgi:hypothetical protein
LVRSGGAIKVEFGRRNLEGVPAVDAAQLIWPLASNAQNSMQAVSAQGSRHCVLNAPLELLVQTLDGILVRSDFHCSGG